MKTMVSARKASGLTQTELAKRCGVSRLTIGRLEAGKTSPSLKVAKKIASVLGCTLDELVAETEEQKHV